jgi:hypothetical protein
MHPNTHHPRQIAGKPAAWSCGNGYRATRDALPCARESRVFGSDRIISD